MNVKKAKQPEPDDGDDQDHAEFSLPDGQFSVTGARDGKLSLCIGIAIVVMALGFAIANIIDSVGGK